MFLNIWDLKYLIQTIAMTLIEHLLFCQYFLFASLNVVSVNELIERKPGQKKKTNNNKFPSNYLKSLPASFPATTPNHAPQTHSKKVPQHQRDPVLMHMLQLSLVPACTGGFQSEFASALHISFISDKVCTLTVFWVIFGEVLASVRN